MGGGRYYNVLASTCNNVLLLNYKCATLDFNMRLPVFERDLGICKSCGADCEKIKRVFWRILDTDAQAFYGQVVGFNGKVFWEADHVLERGAAGANTLENQQTLCMPCHRQKTNKFRQDRRKPASTEIKSRSIRLDDENWEWLSGLPGRSANESISTLRTLSGGSMAVGPTVKTLTPDTRLDEALELLRSLPETFMEAMDAYKARNQRVLPAVDSRLSAPFISPAKPSDIEASPEGFYTDPATIPGVSLGLPPKPVGSHPCRCIHSGCRGANFLGTSKFQNLCPECSESGHRGEPRNCGSCSDDSGTGAL